MYSTFLCVVFIAGFTAGLCSNEWDIIVYSQQWPESICIEGNLTKDYNCSLAANVTTWTVHGAWPSLNGTKGPNYCDDADKFQPDPIQPLLSTMLQYWPNLHTDDTFYSFWTHEWEKHGTCAKSLPTLAGEYNYFNTALKLNKRFDLLSLLKARKLVPSSEGYDYNMLMESLKEDIGANIVMTCFYEKKFGVQYLLQVEICLNKTLDVVDCAPSTGGCLETHPVVYPEIKHPFVTPEDQDDQVLRYIPLEKQSLKHLPLE